MDSTVMTRQQAKSGSWQVIAVTVAGETVAGKFKLRPGLRDGETIRIPRQRLEQAVAGEHVWPADGIPVTVRVPDWRVRNGVAGLLLLAGLVAGAPSYTALLAVLWSVVAFSARYRRLHAADRFRPPVRWRFWPLLRDTLAAVAPLYLLPIGAAVAFYLVLGAALRVFGGPLTVRQLTAMQQALSRVSGFFGDWIKLKERPMFLVLIGVWLLTCLLLVWCRRETGAGSAQRPGGRRLRAAQRLQSVVSGYSRYSGPVAATLATLAAFTFLTTVPGHLGTQLRLQAVERSDDYRHAARRIEADLTTQVVSQLYTRIRNAMPPEYQEDLSTPYTAQVTTTWRQADALVVPLRETHPAAARQLAREQARIQQVQQMPDESLIAGPRGDDPIAIPGDLTSGQAENLRRNVDSAVAARPVAIVDDSGKQVLLQLEKVASEPAWDAAKDLVKAPFPLAVPLIDALAEACDAHLQETLRAKLPDLVRELGRKATDMSTATAAAAKSIVDAVDISELAGKYTAQASRLLAGRKARLADLKKLQELLDTRTSIVDGIVRGTAFEAGIDDVLRSPDQAVRTGVLDDLRQTMRATGSDKNTRIGRSNAAAAINELGRAGLPLVTPADLTAAAAICGCGRR